MSSTPRVNKYKSLRNVVTRLRDDLRSSSNGGVDFVLLFAYNRTGKTRLSMEFKDVGKKKRGQERDTLYFNAFTEDLFYWNNDLEGDSERVLNINDESKFFNGLDTLALEPIIEEYLHRYANFSFDILFGEKKVIFNKEVKNPRYREGNNEPELITKRNIKVSRGEENIFIWCFFLAICEKAILGAESYNWVRFLYIDDPISSLDDNNTIAIANDLTKLLRKLESTSESNEPIKAIVSSHHGLFFNVMCNELKKTSHKVYYYSSNDDYYFLQGTTDTPFFHHIATLAELKKAIGDGKLYTYHFNVLRTIFEKVSSFFGYDDFSYCLDDTNAMLHARALNVFSHRDSYSIYQPRPMVDDNKKLFSDIFEHFVTRFEIKLP
ncbi:anticodon nuclease [Photobacterium iliopiscarium]|uniref:anticodon nuclease n=1 Tax=Photobacterium iliopiscarium TaxID=56192 RepID=UPI000D17DF39|nr:anticodon nuclease [Photobacterium iliopiscarium]PST95328.1 anticodon nuclease [Photobacterium iliopiscarium]